MDIKQTRVKNLKHFVESEGGAAALSRKFDGIDASYLSQLINGHRPFGEKSARKIELICNLRPNFFDSFDEKNTVYNSNIIETQISIKRCPLISWVRAGELCDVGHVYSVEDAEEWLICGAPHGNRTFALRVVGDSMSPEYQEGWHIFVDPDVQAQHNDDVIVRDETGNATFKRLQMTPEGNFLLALNPDYPNRIIKVPGNSTICGVVIYSGRKRK